MPSAPLIGFMRGNEWYGQEPLVGEQESPGIPIQYSVNFPWGEWYVSERAHEELGIVPLAPVSDGYNQQTWIRDDEVPTRIFLVAPGELGIPQVQPTQTRVIAVSSPDSTEFRIAIGSTTVALLDRVIDNAIDETLTNNEGIPFREVAKHHTPQVLIHEILRSLLSAIPDEMYTAGSIDRHRELYKTISQTGEAALAGTGVSIAIGIAEHSELAVVGGVASIAAIGLYLTAKLRRIMILESSNAPIKLNAAREEALDIARDIHDIYCRDHFDREFGDDDSPSLH